MNSLHAHILIIDDDKQRRDTLAEQLHQQGHPVSTASSTEPSLALLATQSFELVLLDVAIASTHEFNLLRQIMQDPSLNHHPIIILANAQQAHQIAPCLTQGAADYLITPTNPTLLQTRVETSLEHKYLNEQLRTSWDAFNEMERLADDLRHVILPLGISLSVEKDFDRLLEKIVIEAKKVCHADAGTLYLRTADDKLDFVIFRTNSLGIFQGGTTGTPPPFAPLPLYDPETGQPNHHNVATHVVLTGESENLPDIYRVSGFDFSGTKAMDDRNNYRSISCLTVPLKSQMNGIIGALQLLNALDEDTQEVVSFDVYHQLVVESLASQAAVVLHNQILRERQESLHEFQQQLRIGRQIQSGFFPAELPQPPGWELTARFHPAREVAGDFYDSFLMPQGKVALVIADVCDKGLAAALFMSLVRSLIRAFSQHQYLHQPAGAVDMTPDGDMAGERPFSTTDFNTLLDTIMRTNAYIEANHRQSNMFATLFFGILNPKTGQLSYINAGHNPPVIFNAEVIKTFLRPTGPAVGLRQDVIFEVHQTVLSSGDTLLAFTDGVTEARNPIQQSFTMERLLALLPSYAHSADNLLAHIDEQVRQHIAEAEPYDDITLLAVRRST